MKWKDVTSRSQGEPTNSEARIWHCHLGPIRLGVHRHINSPVDVWLMSCHALCVENEELEEKNIDEAKATALRWVEAELRHALECLNGPRSLADIEREVITQALSSNGGSAAKAARQLGISTRTIQYRRKEWRKADIALARKEKTNAA